MVVCGRVVARDGSRDGGSWLSNEMTQDVAWRPLPREREST